MTWADACNDASLSPETQQILAGLLAHTHHPAAHEARAAVMTGTVFCAFSIG
jgi:hypothetical protein